jgi:hypothetical protein
MEIHRETGRADEETNAIRKMRSKRQKMKGLNTGNTGGIRGNTGTGYIFILTLGRGGE